MTIQNPRIPTDLQPESANQFGRWFMALAFDPCAESDGEQFVYAIFAVDTMPPVNEVITNPSATYERALVIGYAPSCDYAARQVAALVGMTR